MEKVVIKCDKNIELQDYSYINKVNLILDNYIINKINENENEIIGEILLKIEYFNKENNVIFKDEKVPFEVKVLNGKILDEIIVENMNYYEIVNQGIHCEFEIKIYLSDLKKENLNNEIANDNMYSETFEEEIIDPIAIEIKEKYDSILDELFKSEDENNISYEDNKTNNIIENDELNKIDEELENVFLNDKNINTEMNTNININKVERSEIDKLMFRNIPEIKNTYRVYFPKGEKEIDKVCLLENVSLSTIYKNDLNRNIEMKKRIILEK